MNVEIKNMPRLRIGAVHHVGPYSTISKAFEQLGRFLGRAGMSGPAEMVAIYYDDPRGTPPDKLHSDAAIVLAAGVPLPSGLAEQHIPAGPYASTVYVGPYDGLGDAWMELMNEWMPTSGHKMGAGFSYEVYLNNPMDTPKDQLRTELRMPLA